MNTSLQTLVDMKQMEIDDLKQTLKLYTPQSPPNIDAFFEIMNAPDLDRKMSADDSNQGTEYQDHDFELEVNPLVSSNENLIRTYTKKPIIIVKDRTVLKALNYLVENMDDYSRNPLRGIDIGGVRYAFYYGRISTGGVFGILKTVVLSSELKVYNVKDIKNPVQMNWNQDKHKKGKRGYGHIYLGKLAGEKGFEVYLQDAFKSELGIFM